MLKLKISILLCTVLCYWSCEKKLNWRLPSEASVVVVDAIITDEFKFQEINIYRNDGNLNGPLTALSNAMVYLSDSIQRVLFMEKPEKAGTYVSEIPFAADTGITYTLIVTYGTYSDTAQAVMQAIDKMDPLKIVEYDSLYRIAYEESVFSSMMDIEYDWSDNPTFCNLQGKCSARESFYTIQSIEILKEFAPEKQIISFPRNTRIVRCKYSLSADHENFVRSLLIESEWRGGLFDVEQANLPTNFMQETQGWFGICAVKRDTAYFN